MAVIFFNPKSFLKVILTLEKVGLKLLQYRGIFITLAPGLHIFVNARMDINELHNLHIKVTNEMIKHGIAY